MADAHRGVIFTFKARTDASVGREAARLSKVAMEAQKRFDAIHFDPLDIGKFDGSMSRLSESYQQHVSRMNGKKIAPKADTSGWKTLSAVGKEALDNQKRWAAGVEKLNAQRAANAKAAADAEIREINRVQKERQKTLRHDTKSDSDFWKSFEKHGQKSKKDREREEDHDRREAERQALLDKRRAEREAKERTADESQWDLILGGRQGGARAGTAGMRRPSRRDISDPFGLADYQQGQQRDRKRQEQAEQRERRDAEIALARQRESYSRLGESIGSTTDAVTRLAEGMAYLGLIGERDLGRLSNSLLAIRGTADTIRGGVGTMRDIGGLLRSVREVRHAGGVGGIGRAILGMGPAVGGTAVGTGAAGAAGVGGTAAAASATIPVGLIAAAGTSVAAALASAGLTIREAMQYGIGGGAHVGGVIDRVATAEAGMATRAAGMGLSIVGGIHNMSAPFGLTEMQRELRTEKYLQQFSRGSAFSESAFSNRQTERMTRHRQYERAKRQELGNGQAIGFEYETRNAQEAMEARRRVRTVRYNRLAMDAQVDPNASRREVQAGRERAAALRMREHEENRAEAQAELLRTGRELQRMSQSGRNHPGYEAAERQHEESVRRVVELEEKGLDLARQQRTVEIDGARQRLQLIHDQHVAQTKRTQSLQGRKEDFEVRFSRMDPIQRQALINAKKRLLNGEELTMPERDSLRDADADSQQRLYRYERRLGRAELSKQEARDVDLGVSEREDYENARGAKNDLRTKHKEDFAREQQRLGRGVNVGVGVDNKIAISIKQDDNFYQNLEAKVVNALKPLLKERDARLPDYIQEVARRVAAEVTNEAINQQNQQGRNLAGGLP